MTSVYIVEQGIYSDYRVVGIYSTQENADYIAEKMNASESYDQAIVKERPLDPAVEQMRAGLSNYTVQMFKDGTVKQSWTNTSGDIFAPDYLEEVDMETINGTARGPNYLQASVWATDDKHAIKMTNDHRIQLLALGRWNGKL